MSESNDPPPPQELTCTEDVRRRLDIVGRLAEAARTPNWDVDFDGSILAGAFISELAELRALLDDDSTNAVLGLQARFISDLLATVSPVRDSELQAFHRILSAHRQDDDFYESKHPVTSRMASRVGAWLVGSELEAEIRPGMFAKILHVLAASLPSD